MVKKCCIKYCASESVGGCGISFHRIPKNEEMRQMWMKVISANIRQNSVVCSLHFKPEDFTVSCSRKTLKANAIPSVFLVEKKKKIIVLSNISVALPTIQMADNSVPGPSYASQLDMLSYEPPIKKQCHEMYVQTEYGISKKEDELKRKVKVLSQRLNRRDAKISNLKVMLNLIKNKTNNFDEVKTMTQTNFLDICKKFNTGKHSKGVRYSDEMKQFSLSLYFYSARAYLYLRNYVQLPHPATLRKILCTNNCNVGFLQEVFEYLKVNSSDIKDVALIFDAMSIKSEVTYDKNKDKLWGYVDFGGIVPIDPEQVAVEVIVFQIVSLKSKFKCPIAYFFINKITANIQAQIILTAVRLLSEINITVRSLTCDGTVANVSTYVNLGCKFDLADMVTSFKHPTEDLQIHCTFDPAHMLKLCRNVFAEMNLSSDRGKVDFNYIKELHNIQEEEGLRLANKLNAAHVNFFRKKMNVKLAAQLLSASVANSLDFLNSSGNIKFRGCEATVEYIRIIDRLFDILNAKNPLGRGFKSPLRLSNKEIWCNVLKKGREYLLSLKIDGNCIMSHRRKMAVFGLIVDTFSIENLALDMLTDKNLNYFLPYKMSQDNLEMFFSCIRARGGGNDNPNAAQFRFTLRKLLYRNSIKPSVNANCIDDAFELTPILEFRSQKRTLLEPINSVDPLDLENGEILMSYLDSDNLSDYKLNILYYISGYLVNKLIDKISCNDCHAALISSKQHSDHNYIVNITKFTSFTVFIDRGNLKYVTKFVFELIICCEKLFIANTNAIVKTNMLISIMRVFHSKLYQLFQPPHPLQSLQCEQPHEVHLVKLLANAYLNLRIFHHAKTLTLKNKVHQIGLRQKLHKTVLFSNI